MILPNNQVINFFNQKYIINIYYNLKKKSLIFFSNLTNNLEFESHFDTTTLKLLSKYFRSYFDTTTLKLFLEWFDEIINFLNVFHFLM